jgi:replicative DNA helicase
MDRLPIVIDDSEDITAARLQSKVRRGLARLRSEHPRAKLGVIAIDYLQLMSGEGGGNRNEQLSQISRALKRMAKAFDCTVLALSQLTRPSREQRTKRPQLHDLRDSGALEADADLVLFVHREDEYRDDPAMKDGKAEIIVAKGRNVGTAVHEVNFDGRYTEFYEGRQTTWQ